MNRSIAGRIVGSGLAAAALLSVAVAAAAQDDPPSPAALHRDYVERIRPLLENHCIGCHDETTKSPMRLDTLDPDIKPNTILAWTRVKNRLDVGSMPPKGEPRPTRGESEQLLAWIAGSLNRYDADHKENGGDPLIRRINNRAYTNMVKTLLDVPAQGIEDFPADGQVHGFDTVGSGLYTTSSLYELYWRSAQQTLDMALPESASQPKAIEFKRTFKAKGSGFDTLREYLKKTIATLRVPPKACSVHWIAVLMSRPVLPPAFQKMLDSDLIVKAVASHYGDKSFAAVNAKGIDWVNDPACDAAVIAALEAQIQRLDEMEQYVSEFQPVATEYPGFQQAFAMTMDQPGCYVISARLCLLNPSCPLPVAFSMNGKIVDSFMLYDPQTDPKTYEAKVYCGSGRNRFAIQAAFPTAIFTSEHGYLHFFINYMTERFGLTKEQSVRAEYLDASHVFMVAPANLDGPGKVAENLDLPAILCSEVSVRGPSYEAWPTPAAARIFTRGPAAPPTREYAEEIVKAFTRRAYAMGDCDLDTARPFVDLIMSHYGTGKNFVAAVKYGLAAILSSPRFIYLDETQRTESSRRKPLDAFELARRLAYFLWSDLPDDALLASATSGTLLESGELAAQTQRMLKDGRSRAFREAFTTQWLKIDKLGTVPFSYEILPAFSIVLLNSAKAESVAFFSELLDKNLSITSFLDCDFAMLDGCMAQHYGIPGITGNDFRRVQLPPGAHRGGVLTQASVLMATSNGMVGSLVRRGVFIMERLLGVSLGPPPPDVPALDKVDTVGSDGSPLSPRERMAKHRENASCARCHDQIDPLGVGLENFNALGSWSANLRLLLPAPDKKTHSPWVEREADVHGAMLDGTPYEGADELKRQLLKHGDRFARCFAEYLTVYALGRDLELSDRSVLDGICAKAAAEHYGLQSLVAGVIQSEIFRCK